VLEGDDGLGDAVFGDFEVWLGEVHDEFVFVVEDGAVEDDFFDIAAEGVAVIAFGERAGVAAGGSDVMRGFGTGLVVGGIGGDDGIAIDGEGFLGFGRGGRGLGLGGGGGFPVKEAKSEYDGDQKTAK